MKFFFDILKSIAILLLFVWLIQILINILKSKFRDDRFKWIWMAVVTFLPVIGMLLYYFMGENYKDEDRSNED
jgi:cardiolipin synthase A/B